MKIKWWWSKRDKIALEAMKALIAKTPVQHGTPWENQERVSRTVAGAFHYADSFLLGRVGKEIVWVRPVPSDVEDKINALANKWAVHTWTTTDRSSQEPDAEKETETVEEGKPDAGKAHD